MKKMMLILVALVAFATVAAAQPRALGIRGGFGAELSYQHTLGGANFAEIDLGWWATGINAAAAYEFSFMPESAFNVYAGPAANVRLFNDGNSAAQSVVLGLGAQLGMEYNFSIPLQISLDWRPLYNFVNANGFGWNHLALGIRYRF